jgi:hypothetical protein
MLLNIRILNKTKKAKQKNDQSHLDQKRAKEDLRPLPMAWIKQKRKYSKQKPDKDNFFVLKTAKASKDLLNGRTLEASFFGLAKF